MRYEIEVGGRAHQVVVRAIGDAFAVQVDGRTWHVDAARIDAQTLSLIVDKVCPYDVTIAPVATGRLVAYVGATPVPVVMNGRRRRAGAHDRSGDANVPERVTAPMPGKIVRVLVKPGDRVDPRQPMVVVEAMKMENELRAGRAGIAAEVHAREGMSVDAGALLVVIQ